MKDNTELKSTKLSEEALKRIRIIAAMTGEKQYQVIERLSKQELERLQSTPSK